MKKILILVFISMTVILKCFAAEEPKNFPFKTPHLGSELPSDVWNDPIFFSCPLVCGSHGREWVYPYLYLKLPDQAVCACNQYITPWPIVLNKENASRVCKAVCSSQGDRWTGVWQTEQGFSRCGCLTDAGLSHQSLIREGFAAYP